MICKQHRKVRSSRASYHFFVGPTIHMKGKIEINVLREKKTKNTL